ncbi:MAG TPA: radical SAM protein, partial [Spirochaetia bacterium]|nr:radical SAM protein [Spirochaetia bacterium]
MRVMLIQPPFVQLNAPYPAVHFLEAYLRGTGIEAFSFDHSIALYRAIFSREGCARIFKDAEHARVFGEPPDAESRRQLGRFMSYRDMYLEWIDGIVDFLSGGDPGFAHRLAQAAEFPRGQRAQAFIEASGGRIGPDDARALATRILEDLADLVSFALDPEFATVRYGERLARSVKDFHSIEEALPRAYLMEAFYRPWLRQSFSAAAVEGLPDLLLFSIPFPGCLTGALVAAREARAAFGGSVHIVFGGGYVSTELRSLTDGRLFDYCDYLAFDAGYGSLASILEVEAGSPKESLYQTMYRDAEGRVCRGGDNASSARFKALEQRALARVFPDYRSVDFADYLRVVDSENPMHRLWSDTPWLKYRLAHGCYWKRCTFCDTELDYVAR